MGKRSADDFEGNVDPHDAVFAAAGIVVVVLWALGPAWLALLASAIVVTGIATIYRHLRCRLRWGWVFQHIASWARPYRAGSYRRPAGTVGRGATMSAYLIWSNEHNAWWAPNRRGYTRVLAKAGRYSQAEAVKTARDAGYYGLHPQVPCEIAVREQDAIDGSPPLHQQASTTL